MPTILSPFSIAVRTVAAGEFQEVTDFEQINVKFHLIDGDTISFTTSGRSSAAPYIDGLATDVYLYNNTAMVSRADHLWQVFRLLPPDQEWGDSGENVVSLSGICYKQILKSRFLHSALPQLQIDEGAIILALINHTQALTGGYLGIVTETPTSSYLTTSLRDRTEYKNGDNIGTLISDLTKVQNGPVWRVAPGIAVDKRLTVQKPTLFATADQPAVHQANCRRLKRSPGSLFANAGFSPGSSATLGSWYDSPTMSTDPRGRWEATRSSSSSVINQAQVDEVARGVVDDYGKPPATWTLDVTPSRWLTDSNYLPGMFVPLKVPPNIVDPLGDENAVMKLTQVIEVSLTVSAAGDNSVIVTAVEV